MITRDFFSFLEKEGVRGLLYQFENEFTALQYSFPHEVSRDAMRQGDLALDWGCGNGHFSYYLNYLGIDTVGYSFDGWPDCMRGKENYSYKMGDVENSTMIDFPDGQFDAVFSIGVLEHVHELGGSQLESMKQIARILKDGGRFYCFHLPNKYSLSEALISLVYQFTTVKGSAPHSKKFIKKDVEALAQGAGLRVVEYQRYNLLPRNLTRRLLPFIAKSRSLCFLLDRFDFALSKLFPVLCNQIYFCAEKQA